MKSMLRWSSLLLTAAFAMVSQADAEKSGKKLEESPLDRYVREANESSPASERTAGSIWSPGAPFTDLGRDLRARFVNDTVTVLVVERASASAKGSVKSERKSGLKASVDAVGGLTRAKGPLANLASASSQSSLDGAGTTSRETTASTTLTGRVAAVLPNGNLVIEATKEVVINSERQVVTLRGVARPNDLTSGNMVRSDHLAQLEVRINGKGVVGDAIRKPFFLYRLLLGILPL